MAGELGARIEELRAVESQRPYYEYRNLYHDPRGASEGKSVVPSPLARGPADPLVAVGNHGHSHGHMAWQDAATQRLEMEQAGARLKAELGAAPELFAYPYGEGTHMPATTWNGRVGGQTYHLKAALLVGASPAPSPYSRAWKPLAVPRIAGPGYKVWVLGRLERGALVVRRLGVLAPPAQNGARIPPP